MGRSRNILRALLIVALILLISEAAASRSLRVMAVGPDPLDNASAVFEATVVAVFGPKGDEPARVRLLVTSDWRRAYRGFASLGQTIDVPFRSTQLLNALGAAKRSPGTRYLYAIDTTTGEIAMVAQNFSKNRFRVVARAPVESSSQSSASEVYFVNGAGYTGHYLETQLKARFRDERDAFLKAVAKPASDAAAKLGAAALEHLVGQLDASDFAARDKAHKRLVAAGLANAPALRAALERADSLETSRRLARIERQIALQRALQSTRAEIAARGSSMEAERKELGPRAAADTATTRFVFGGRLIRRR